MLLNVIVEPAHTAEGPLIVPAFRPGLTEIFDEADEAPHVVDIVYVIVALPAATPVTTPVAAFTVADEVLLLLQVPPLVPLLVNGVDVPIHIVAAPLTTPAVGTIFTVTSFVAVEVTQLFVNV